MIEKCTPTDLSSSPVDLSPPIGRRHMRKSSLFTPPTSPPQTPVVSERREREREKPITWPSYCIVHEHTFQILAKINEIYNYLL